ncbi:hypothetical protein AC579_2586 [Pseudocercospora musae]|uniref:Uncharacterized protein n=1 Tax=Pseudocercospora musae TaxID=113226 RepID=A0A139IES4_9PEZI|nr:hypothetical protein AC579_2586 [Pseudocercospora musae]
MPQARVTLLRPSKRLRVWFKSLVPWRDLLENHSCPPDNPDENDTDNDQTETEKDPAGSDEEASERDSEDKEKDGMEVDDGLRE